jgi:hypothetical protein
VRLAGGVAEVGVTEVAGGGGGGPASLAAAIEARLGFLSAQAVGMLRSHAVRMNFRGSCRVAGFVRPPTGGWPPG